MRWDMRKYPTKYLMFSLIESIFETLTFSFLAWFRIFNELNLTEFLNDKKNLSEAFSKSPFPIAKSFQK